MRKKVRDFVENKRAHVGKPRDLQGRIVQDKGNSADEKSQEKWCQG